MIVLILLVGTVLWLLKSRFPDQFMRGYGLFFLILLVYASNKAAYGIPDSMSEGAFSPLSLVRWGLLGVLFIISMRMKRPPQFRVDVPSQHSRFYWSEICCSHRPTPRTLITPFIAR
jgi:hypothetical protein